MEKTKIKSEGTFVANVTDAFIKKLSKDSEDYEDGFKIILRCETEDKFTYWEGEYSQRQVTWSDDYSGEPVLQMTTDTLKEIGIQDGYVGNVQQAIDSGLNIRAKVVKDEWVDNNGEQQSRYYAKYINPVGMKRLSEVDIDKLAQKITGIKPPEKKQTVIQDADVPQPQPDTDDNTPF